MKITRILLGIWLSLFATSMALGQALVQQSPTRLDVATGVAAAVGAINTQQTATITVPAGQYAYITAVGLSACQNATSTAISVATFTSTNLATQTGGTTPTWLLSAAATAQLCYFSFESYGQPIKSASPGTAVTIVSPAAVAQAGFGIRAYYYTAP